MKTHLSAREKEVLTLLTQGKSNKQVATALGIGCRTVETHRGQIYKKCHVTGIAELTRYALEVGLVDLLEFEGNLESYALTRGEIEVLKFSAMGKTSGETASELLISPGGVNKRRDQIAKKLKIDPSHCTLNAILVHFAARHHVVPLNRFWSFEI